MLEWALKILSRKLYSTENGPLMDQIDKRTFSARSKVDLNLWECPETQQREKEKVGKLSLRWQGPGLIPEPTLDPLIELRENDS